jgi:hypothetical protein
MYCCAVALLSWSFSNVQVSGQYVLINREYVLSDSFELHVSMYIANMKTSTVIQLKNVVQVLDYVFLATVWNHADDSVLHLPRYDV